jgi:hypothetical protein
MQLEAVAEEELEEDVVDLHGDSCLMLCFLYR